jgi:hypothetical protein
MRVPMVAGLAAWVGLVLGHVASYALAYPSGQARHAHLLLTGHGWMGPALVSLAAAVPAVLAVAAARSARHGPLAVRPLATRLLGVQILAFLLVEVAERHADLGRALSDPAVLVGVVVQALVAVAVAALLSGFTRGVVAVVRRRRRARLLTRPDSQPASQLRAPHRPALLASPRRRAPPLALLAR